MFGYDYQKYFRFNSVIIFVGIINWYVFVVKSWECISLEQGFSKRYTNYIVSHAYFLHLCYF